MTVAHSDDTEIFFSQAAGDPNNHPNIVFHLDNSTSMEYASDGTPVLKFATMKAAMNEIIDTADNINLGLTSFKVNDLVNHGTEVIFPVTPIGSPGARVGLRNAVQNLQAYAATPLVGALYEATMVMRGGNIDETAATYTSPMVGECQKNHIVLLSDGAPWGNPAEDKTKALIGGTCQPAGFGNCGVELAEWLNNTDHAPHLSNNQNVTVSTIGFHLTSDYLKDVAAAGGGEYYEAQQAHELVAAFKEIISNVKEANTTFIAPTTSINQFNRLAQSNDLYFSMFQPKSSATWVGNLKRYQLAYQAGEIIIADANGNDAIDDTTGFFKDTARSFWSSMQDGSQVELGGAAGEMNSASRRIYTHIGAIPPGGVELVNELTPSSSVVSAELGHLPQAQREDIINWVRGEDVLDDVPGPERLHMGDVLHSSPVTVNYGGGESIVYVGTNEGFLHGISRSSGREKFSFIPQELVGNLEDFYTNTDALSRRYGLDGSVTFEHIDVDNDSVVNGADKAYLYVGMRRGGRNYYALDVTNPNQPRLLWKIEGGAGDFARLGQTWSRATPSRIQYNGSPTDVLIFGGGYDTNQDPENNPSSGDSVGNTVFIVNARTGQRLWSAYDNVPNISTGMSHSIPSDLRIVDLNGDAFADRIYVGDLGGAVWRFDLKQYHQSGDGLSNLVEGYQLADLGTGGNRTRFFNEPDVALISDKGKRFMSVSIGSGWRSHPLYVNDQDQFFMIRDPNPLHTPTSWTTIVHGDLLDVTTSLSTDPSRSGVADPEGWRLRLTSNGEKNLSKSVTINDQVVFSTYAPAPSSDVCEPPSGQSYAYALDVVHGDPVLDLSGGSSGSSPSSTSDRRAILNTEGIPPGPTAVIAQVGGEIRTTVMVGPETPLSDLPFSDLTKRTYWQGRGRGQNTPASCRALVPGMC